MVGPAMKRPRPKWLDRAGFNPFRLLPPGQAVIARARKAGVDTTSRPAIAEWRADGEPEDVK